MIDYNTSVRLKESLFPENGWNALFYYFLNCSDWLDKSWPSKKVIFVLIM